MIVREQITDNLIRIFSDCGKDIVRLDIQMVFHEAFEKVNGKHYEYEEVEVE